jgi:hypothetical protein
MELVIDPDIKTVAEFMQCRFSAARLVAVANGLASIAPLLWGQYQPEEVRTLRLACDAPISTHDRHTQSVANE